MQCSLCRSPCHYPLWAAHGFRVFFPSLFDLFVTFYDHSIPYPSMIQYVCVYNMITNYMYISSLVYLLSLSLSLWCSIAGVAERCEDDQRASLRTPSQLVERQVLQHRAINCKLRRNIASWFFPGQVNHSISVSSFGHVTVFDVLVLSAPALRVMVLILGPGFFYPTSIEWTLPCFCIFTLTDCFLIFFLLC